MSSDLVPVSVVREMVKAAIDEALGRTRIPKIITGSVEDLDADTLDVAYVRADQEAMSSDPTQSDNWGSPGVIAITRLGTTNVGEQVRVSFDGPAGGSASLTAAPNAIVLPFGQETGNRIILDGSQGLIIIGDPGPPTPGARIEFDPVGGIRIRSQDDVLVGLIDQAGYTIRDHTTGVVVGEFKGGTSGYFRLVDPVGTDDIEMVTSSLGTLPVPKWVGLAEINPGTTIVAPAAPVFTTTPNLDYSFYHAAAGLAGTSQANTFTPPASTIERFDSVHNTAGTTLAVTGATRVPAPGAAGTFTSSQSNWQHGIGTQVIVRGNETGSPNFRATSEANFGPTNSGNIVVSLPKPAGVVATDVMVAFVSMLNVGGTVPTGWNTPEGWIFLGATVAFSTTGPASTLAVGAWAKLAGATEPTDYTLAITFGAGEKRLHAGIVAISDADLISGGAHIRMAGHPIRRLLAFNELTAPSQQLCDFQDIPPGYDNLELVWDGVSNIALGSGVDQRFNIRFNLDIGNNYHTQVTSNGAPTVILGTNRILLGAIRGNAAGAATSGQIDIYGYSKTGRARSVLGHCTWIRSGEIRDDTIVGYWNDTATAINRIVVNVDGGLPQFGTGARAYLYGY